MIQVKLTIGEEERATLAKLNLQSEAMHKQRKGLRTLCVILTILLAILALLQSSLPYAILAVLVLLFTIFGITAFQRWLIQTGMKKADPRMTSGERSYEIDENGIRIRTELGNGRTAWDAFKEYGTESHYTWIRRMDNNVVLLDRNLLTAEQVSELDGYLKQLKKA